ncbi:hypothetical protein JCM11251_007442 [Rhodosporidiobolus azoricus]
MTQPPPSMIPVPSSPSPALPSPSAFPSLTGDSYTTQSSPASAQQPTGIPSFAALAKKSLPPSKAPEGISVPAAALHRQDTKERLQPSQNGKDSPYARPANGNGQANGAARGKKKSLTGGRGAGAAGNAGGRVKTVSGNAKAAHASQSSAEESTTEKKADRPRTVPGMPASMLPPPSKKKSHGRTKSDAGLAGSSSSSSSAANSSGAANGDAAELGKKRRASLRKVLPPNSSKLSALAPSFDFVPRSATTPNFSSYASSSAEDSALDTDEASPPSPVASRKTEAHTSGSLTPSFMELSLEAEDEPAGKDDLKAEQPPTSVLSAAPASPPPSTTNASEPLSAQEKQDIKETVASAGAQGDEFCAKTFEQADQEGVKEVAGAENAGEQSASADKPTALPSAPEDKVELVEAVAEPVPERTDRSLAAFLPSAFTPAASRSASGTATPSGVAFAPLVLPEAEEQKKENEPQQAKKETIPGAVHEAPLAPFAYEEKEGWWSDSYVPQYRGPLLDIASSATGGRNDATIPAAVESAQAEQTQVLLKYPAWQPAKEEEGKDDRPAKELANPTDALKFASFLPTAFSERVDIPTSAEAVTASASLPSLADESAPTSSPSLASFLSSSFAPLASTGFAPLEEVRAEALAKGAKKDTDFPLSAEEVAAQPSLDDELEEAAEVTEGADSKKKEERKGWWSPDFKPSPSTSTPPISKEEQSKAAATVQSAGAQADGFVAKGFTEVDREGAKEVEGKRPAEQSASPTAYPEAEGKKTFSSSPSDASRAPSSSDATSAAAPLGSFLSSAFSADAPPSAEAFPPADPTTDLPPSIPPPAALTSGTIRSAGAQGDAYVGRTFTAADSIGVVEEHKVPEKEAHQTNALGQYLTKHFVEEAKDEGEESGQNTVTSTQAAAASSSATTALAPSTSTSPSTSSVPAKRSGGDHDDDEDDDQKKRRTTSPPTDANSGDKDAPSLTLALSTAWATAPWTRKLWAVIASLGINVGLPFINGVMLGFGELFARNVLGVRLGWPLHSSSPTVPATGGRANTAGVGLRSAGTRIGTEVPQHAGAKTAVEAVVEGASQS